MAFQKHYLVGRVWVVGPPLGAVPTDRSDGRSVPSCKTAPHLRERAMTAGPAACGFRCRTPGPRCVYRRSATFAHGQTTSMSWVERRFPVPPDTPETRYRAQGCGLRGVLGSSRGSRGVLPGPSGLPVLHWMSILLVTIMLLARIMVRAVAMSIQLVLTILLNVRILLRVFEELAMAAALIASVVVIPAVASVVVIPAVASVVVIPAVASVVVIPAVASVVVIPAVASVVVIPAVASVVVIPAVASVVVIPAVASVVVIPAVASVVVIPAVASVVVIPAVASVVVIPAVASVVVIPAAASVVVIPAALRTHLVAAVVALFIFAKLLQVMSRALPVLPVLPVLRVLSVLRALRRATAPGFRLLFFSLLRRVQIETENVSKLAHQGRSCPTEIRWEETVCTGTHTVRGARPGLCGGAVGRCARHLLANARAHAAPTAD